MDFWSDVSGRENSGYCVLRLANERRGMAALKAMFPTGDADEMNFVLFSTSGTHGSYQTLEEEETEPGTGVTFMVVQPRLVITRYGVVYPESDEDFALLKKLRATSREALLGISGGV